MKTPIRHWLVGHPYAAVSFRGHFDNYDTACCQKVISKSQEPEHFSRNPHKVTCKLCRRTFVFKHETQRPYVPSLKAQQLLPPLEESR